MRQVTRTTEAKTRYAEDDDDEGRRNYWKRRRKRVVVLIGVKVIIIMVSHGRGKKDGDEMERWIKGKCDGDKTTHTIIVRRII